MPPYAAVQAVPGLTHRRGTPSAVVETDAQTWLALAHGELSWAAGGRERPAACQWRAVGPEPVAALVYPSVTAETVVKSTNR